MLTVTAVSAGGNTGDTANCILTAVGAQAGLSSGLRLIHGTADGQLTTSATNLGAQGTGVNSPGSPADWNGTQAISGHFNTGAGFNDVLDHNPATGNGAVLYGSGDGSSLLPYSGNQANVNSTASTNSTGAKATSIASGGNLYNTLNGEPATGYPDLLMIVGSQLWDEPSATSPGTFVGVDNAVSLSATNPTGSGDWTGWNSTGRSPGCSPDAEAAFV